MKKIMIVDGFACPYSIYKFEGNLDNINKIKILTINLKMNFNAR